ncbi:MAG TPA: hypothetical protein VK501_13790 [Baekduia sp.]|uniref:hypothetical protein n=1 Tax=Baekduia sp. TaxID=2600305 RepID=UPI002B5A0043|nr:hypothetical protein [Baekduia sp.]HMJ34979.1 hypothetical protein [Baekduia sp.]
MDTDELTVPLKVLPVHVMVVIPTAMFTALELVATYTIDPGVCQASAALAAVGARPVAVIAHAITTDFPYLNILDSFRGGEPFRAEE